MDLVYLTGQMNLSDMLANGMKANNMELESLSKMVRPHMEGGETER